MRLLRPGATLVAVLAWSRIAAAGDPAIAREQLKVGYTLAQDGKCGEAVPHLAESLRLDPKAITLINLADCEEKLGKLTDAMTHWVDARARALAEGATPIQEEAEKRAKLLDGRVPRLTISLAGSAPPDAVVERDGVALGAPSIGIPLPIDPGPHTIVVRAKGRADNPTSVTLAEGESRKIEVDAAAVAEAPVAPVLSEEGRKEERPTSALVWVGFGVAVVGVGVGAVTGIMALGAGSDAETTCPQLQCSSKEALDDVESGRTIGTVSTIAFIVAGVGTALGVYGLLTRPEAKAKTAHAKTIDVSVAPFALRGSF